MKNFKLFFSFVLGLFSIITNTNAFGVNNAGTSQTQSSILSVWDIQDKNQFNKVITPYASDGVMIAMMMSELGYEGTDTNQTKDIFSRNRIHETFKANGATAAGAANAAVTLTATAASIDANIGLYVQPQMEIRFSNGVVGIIQSKPTSSTISVIPKLLGTAIPAVAANEELIVYSNSFGQGTGQPDSIQGSFVKQTFTSKISKGEYEVTNTAASEKTIFSDQWGNVATAESIESEMRLMSMVSGAFLFDTPNTNTNLIANASSSVIGLNHYISNMGGNTMTYVAGLWNDTYFDQLCSIVEGNAGASQYIGILGTELYGENERKFVQTYGNSNNGQFLKAGSVMTKDGMVSAQSLNTTFGDYTKRQINFKFLKHAETASKVYGNPTAGTYKDVFNGYFIPNGQGQMKNANGQVETTPFFQMLYKNHNGINRKHVCVKRQGMTAGAINTTSQDVTMYECLSEYKTVFHSANKFIKLNAL